MAVDRTQERLPAWSGRVTYAAFAAFVVVGLAFRLPGTPVVAGVAVAVSFAAGWVLMVSRSIPAPVGLALCAGGVVALSNGQPSNPGWFALCVLGWWCVLVAPRAVGLAGWGVAMAALAIEGLVVDADPGWLPWAAGTTLSMLGGALFRHEIDLVTSLRAAQAGLAEQARNEERARIAREVHDVVAHTLTVVLLHLSGARLAARLDPSDAEAALGEAEELTRRSLDEVRHAVGLLRSGPGPGPDAALRPLPSLGDLADLVATFRAAGTCVDLVVEVGPDELPATIGLALYRIAQEALTNATKHAAGAAVSLAVRTDGGTVDLRVESAGSPGRGSGAGMGLIGMRERAEALGGTCDTGPGGPGWVVHARLPVPGGQRALP